MVVCMVVVVKPPPWRRTELAAFTPAKRSSGRKAAVVGSVVGVVVAGKSGSADVGGLTTRCNVYASSS